MAPGPVVVHLSVPVVDPAADSKLKLFITELQIVGITSRCSGLETIGGGVGVAVAEELGDAVDVAVAEELGDAVDVAVAEELGDAVDVAVAEELGDAVDVAVSVGLGSGTATGCVITDEAPKLTAPSPNSDPTTVEEALVVIAATAIKFPGIEVLAPISIAAPANQ
jgi:hypothetical protein